MIGFLSMIAYFIGIGITAKLLINERDKSKIDEDDLPDFLIWFISFVGWTLILPTYLGYKIISILLEKYFNVK